MIVRNKAVVSYEGKWPRPSILLFNTKTVSEVVANVSAALARDGLVVRDYSVPAVSSTQFEFDVRLSLQVENGMGYGSENDIISIVRHEVYQEMHQFPFADSIPKVDNSATGQPTQTTTSTPSKSFQQWIDDLFSDSKLVFTGLAVGAVAAILLIATHEVKK